MTEKEYWIVTIWWSGGQNFSDVCSSEEAAIKLARRRIAKVANTTATIQRVSVIESYNMSLDYKMTKET